MRKLYFFAFLSFAFILTSCHKDNEKVAPEPSSSTDARSFSSGQLQNYFALMCTVSRSSQGFYPTQTARAYGYVGVAAYEAVVNGIPGAMSLSEQLNGFTSLPKPSGNVQYNWAISSNAAVAEMMRDMFGVNLSAANLNTIDSTENANLAALSAGVSQPVITASVNYGKSVSAAIYAISKTDGGDQAYLNPFSLPYTVPQCDSCWVPTNPTVPNPISPKWGSNRPFLAANVSGISPQLPCAFSATNSSTYYTNAMQVYNQVKNNTADQVTIAKFWADDPFNTCTPTGHTFNIMIQLLKENNASLAMASVAFAKLAIAENDAFISCWKCKYQFNRIRPVSYIKQNIDPSFATVIGTPAFPSYASGHAFEIGAASQVFIEMFTNGDGNYNFTDYSQVQYGFATRQYSNFNDLALECANSRFYAGIHYNEDNLQGLAMGRQVGANVVKTLVWPTNLN
jgi:hypothetical protein